MKKLSILFLLCALFAGKAVATPFLLEGAIWYDVIPYHPHAMIYVIGITAIDPITNDTTIAALDSIETDEQGMFIKQYASFPYPQSIRLKAALLPTNANYGDYLPTYYNDFSYFTNWRDLNGYGATLNWHDAKPLDSLEMSGAFLVIRMIGGTNPGGPGFIGGSVSQGANKSTAVGDPLSKRLILLTKSTGEAVAYTYSDAAGKFSFPSVPLGEYKIFGDVAGKNNPALSLSLSTGHATVNTVVFEENSKSFAGHVEGLTVRPGSGLDAVRIAPNPVTDVLRVQGLSAAGGEKTLLLLDATGKELSRLTTTNDEASFETAALPAGLYLLQVRSGSSTASFRVTK